MSLSEAAALQDVSVSIATGSAASPVPGADAILSQLSQTAIKLNALWDSEGVEEERGEKLRELGDALAALLRKRVEDEEAIIASYEQQIEEAGATLAAVQEQTGEAVHVVGGGAARQGVPRVRLTRARVLVTGGTRRQGEREADPQAQSPAGGGDQGGGGARCAHARAQARRRRLTPAPKLTRSRRPACLRSARFWPLSTPRTRRSSRTRRRRSPPWAMC